jgi:ubiquinone/menaquinone biosynthesis C-methylase UbiE
MGNSDATLQKFYGDGFYRKQMSTSLVSARRYASILNAVFQPQSVVDLGCGRGTWLRAFKEIGAKRLRSRNVAKIIQGDRCEEARWL